MVCGQFAAGLWPVCGRFADSLRADCGWRLFAGVLRAVYGRAVGCFAGFLQAFCERFAGGLRAVCRRLAGVLRLAVCGYDSVTKYTPRDQQNATPNPIKLRNAQRWTSSKCLNSTLFQNFIASGISDASISLTFDIFSEYHSDRFMNKKQSRLQITPAHSNPLSAMFRLLARMIQRGPPVYLPVYMSVWLCVRLSVRVSDRAWHAARLVFCNC